MVRLTQKKNIAYGVAKNARDMNQARATWKEQKRLADPKNCHLYERVVEVDTGVRRWVEKPLKWPEVALASRQWNP